MNLAPTPRMLPEAEQDGQDPLLQSSQPQQAGNRPQRETTRAQAEWGQAAWEDARQQEDSPAEGEGSSPARLQEVRFCLSATRLSLMPLGVLSAASRHAAPVLPRS